MKKWLNILLSALVWGVILFYLIWAGNLGRKKRAEAAVNALSVTVADSASVGIVRSAEVARWITAAGLDPRGKQIDSVDLNAITEEVASHDFVRDVTSSVGLGGTVQVTVTQRHPVLRVSTADGHDFYYTADGYIVPAGRNSAHYVPIITGQLSVPFDKSFSGRLPSPEEIEEKKLSGNYIFLYKLINFVEYIEGNDFWNSQIVQINIPGSVNLTSDWNREPEIELIPRVGDHVVMLGCIDGYERKLDKLLTFYRRALPTEGWDKWSYIDLRFDGQVVCSNR